MRKWSWPLSHLMGSVNSLLQLSTAYHLSKLDGEFWQRNKKQCSVHAIMLTVDAGIHSATHTHTLAFLFLWGFSFHSYLNPNHPIMRKLKPLYEMSPQYVCFCIKIQIVITWMEHVNKSHAEPCTVVDWSEWKHSFGCSCCTRNILSVPAAQKSPAV